MNDVYGQAGTGLLRLAVFEPVFQGELGDGLVGVVGDLAQQVLEGVVGGIDAQTAGGLDDGEEDGAASATFQGRQTRPRWVSSVSWVRSGCVRVTLIRPLQLDTLR